MCIIISSYAYYKHLSNQSQVFCVFPCIYQTFPLFIVTILCKLFVKFTTKYVSYFSFSPRYLVFRLFCVDIMAKIMSLFYFFMHFTIMVNQTGAFFAPRTPLHTERRVNSRFFTPLVLPFPGILLQLDRTIKLCYHLFIKGCDEDTRKGKILREEAIR